MSSRRNFGNVRKLKSGRFQARYTDRAGRTQVGPETFATEREADRFLRAVETDLARGTWHDPHAGEVPFENLVYSWRRSHPALRRTTVATYANLLERLLVPFFAGKKANAITPDLVRDWHAWASDLPKASGGKEGGQDRLSPNTVVKAYLLLKAILSVAVEDGVILANPCRLKGAATEHLPEQRLATPEEVERITAAIAPEYKAMVMVAAYCGLRLGEVVALRRHRIDLDAGTIRVAEQVTQPNGGAHEVGPPKTTAGLRTIAIPQAVNDALVHHLSLHSEKGRTGIVFPAPKGGYLSQSNFRSRVWKPALKKAGVDHLRFHDLRHFHATNAAAAGISMKTLMAVMGHASPRAALLYQHPQSDRAVADAMDAMIARAHAPSDASEDAASGTRMAHGHLRIVQ